MGYDCPACKTKGDDKVITEVKYQTEKFKPIELNIIIQTEEDMTHMLKLFGYTTTCDDKSVRIHANAVYDMLISLRRL